MIEQYWEGDCYQSSASVTRTRSAQSISVRLNPFCIAGGKSLRFAEVLLGRRWLGCLRDESKTFARVIELRLEVLFQRNHSLLLMFGQGNAGFILSHWQWMDLSGTVEQVHGSSMKFDFSVWESLECLWMGVDYAVYLELNVTVKAVSSPGLYLKVSKPCWDSECRWFLSGIKWYFPGQLYQNQPRIQQEFLPSNCMRTAVAGGGSATPFINLKTQIT